MGPPTPAWKEGTTNRQGMAASTTGANVTVFFSDFVDFTQVARELSPRELIAELNAMFTAFECNAATNISMPSSSSPSSSWPGGEELRN